MVKSMTGYGKGVLDDGKRKITVELKSVNHRFLDLNIKLPKALSFSEDSIRNAVKCTLIRGHIDVYVNYEDLRQNKSTLKVDEALAKNYINISRELSEKYTINDNIGTYEILRFPDVVSQVVAEDDEEEIAKALITACNLAVEALEKMRIVEGEQMINDILDKLNSINKIVDEIAEFAPQMARLHREKVEERMREYLKEVPIDESRLLNEISVYSDKVAIDEEITRLRSHNIHFNKIAQEGGAVGKKLDFIVQEMNRETNTIGSKCCEIEVSNRVIELKSIIEKIREQIQNIE